MIAKTLKCVVVSSTGGAVMNTLLFNAFFKRQVFSVISDRSCPALDKSRKHGIAAEIFEEKEKVAFSDRLLAYLERHEVDYVISFYTKLFVGRILASYQDRIINLHPSLLPSFPGLDAFGENLRSGARYLGSTIHFIDEHLDRGKVILQTVFPLDVNESTVVLRHRIFEQQCKSLLQVMKWLSEGRITVRSNHVIVQNARFRDFEYSPNLDFSEAIGLVV